jgi:excisionase family DNA binding protein
MRRSVSTVQSTALLTAEEAARRLNVQVPRLYELSRQGLVPCVRLGRSVRFDSDRLESYIDAGGQPWPGGWRKEGPAR